MFPVFFWIFTTSLNVWSVDIWTVTLQVNWESRSPSVSITGWEFSSINNLLKLRLLDDLTSALDVSCLIMSNKQLVRFVAWIEMWVNRRGCVCPPRHFNKARFVGPGSLKSGTVRSELIEIEQRHHRTIGLGTLVVQDPALYWLTRIKLAISTFQFLINWNSSALSLPVIKC